MKPKREFDRPKREEGPKNQTKEYVYWVEMDMKDLVKRFCNDPDGEQG
jgi:hypothetical protein